MGDPPLQTYPPISGCTPLFLLRIYKKFSCPNLKQQIPLHLQVLECINELIPVPGGASLCSDTDKKMSYSEDLAGIAKCKPLMFSNFLFLEVGTEVGYTISLMISYICQCSQKCPLFPKTPACPYKGLGNAWEVGTLALAGNH